MRTCVFVVFLSACGAAPASVALVAPVAPMPIAPQSVASSSASPTRTAAPDLSWLSSASHVRVIRGRDGDRGSVFDTFDFHQPSGANRFVALATHVEVLAGKKPQSKATALHDVDLGPFLRALSSARAPAPDAPNAVRLVVTDDYPFWDVLVESDRDGAPRAVRFESPSTGARPPPWFVWKGEHRMPIELSKIESIFEAIDPSLRE